MTKINPILAVRDLKKYYSTGSKVLKVLDGAEFDIYPGEVVGLVGPSGSGKSTLLHSIGLLEKPTSGQVIIDGLNCSKLGDKRRTLVRKESIGIVYQFHHLLKEFSALDNVIIPQMVAGKSIEESREEAMRLLKTLGLEGRYCHMPGELSGGEQQRVAIARAISNKPKILLTDGSTGNLDPASSLKVFEQLLALSIDEKITVLVATHNMNFIDYMNRVLTVHKGKAVPF